MKLIYDNKDIELYECKSFFSRLRGFMFKKNIPKLSYITHTLLREKFHLMEIDQDYTFY